MAKFGPSSEGAIRFVWADGEPYKIYPLCVLAEWPQEISQTVILEDWCVGSVTFRRVDAPNVPYGFYYVGPEKPRISLGAIFHP